MADPEQPGKSDDKCAVADSANKNDTTTETDGYLTDDCLSDDYLSDFYVSTAQRTENLRKVKDKKRRLKDGWKKYYKREPEELTEIFELRKEALWQERTNEDLLNLFTNIKYVMHIDNANYREVIHSQKIVLVLFYSHLHYHERLFVPEFLRAAYELKVRFGDRVSTALWNSSVNRKIATTFNNLFSTTPSVLLFRNGKFIQTYEGNRRAEDVKAFIEKVYHREENRRKSSKTKEEDS